MAPNYIPRKEIKRLASLTANAGCMAQTTAWLEKFSDQDAFSPLKFVVIQGIARPVRVCICKDGIPEIHRWRATRHSEACEQCQL
jgi:hypothetical protein